ncbi:MAG: class I SAM-dependent methyltransferase [Proteobacteria bacterium]|nr:class I SAM-dependent methyltransferase [Pseudomonadota bacterium]
MANAMIENVSDTAFWVAHYRGIESKRSNALFHDPLAAVLAGDRGRSIAEAMPRPFLTEWVVAVRTRIIDEFVKGAVGRGVDTVLNLGAGLDTRPYRMDLPPKLHWIEADYPAMIDYKENLLSQEKPRFGLQRVKCDLANDEERKSVLSDVNAKSQKFLVLTEGVVPYLSLDAAGALADDLRSLNHAAYWIVDYLSPQLLKYRERMMSDKMQNAPFLFRPTDWFGFFEQHGWHREEIRYFGEEGDRLGRKIRMPFLALIATIARALVSSAERQNFKNAAGYALMVPK